MSNIVEIDWNSIHLCVFMVTNVRRMQSNYSLIPINMLLINIRTQTRCAHKQHACTRPHVLLFFKYKYIMYKYKGFDLFLKMQDLCRERSKVRIIHQTFQFLCMLISIRDSLHTVSWTFWQKKYFLNDYAWMHNVLFLIQDALKLVGPWHLRQPR